MAIPIKSIPILKNDEAHSFIEKADQAVLNRGIIDFTKQIKNAQTILAKAKILQNKNFELK